VAKNIHASAVVLGDRGVLIAGPSGSGKTGLALALVSHAKSFGLFGRLVGDDQLLLSVHNGRLLCAAPPTIAGLAEVRGLGPSPLEFEARAPVDLYVALVDDAAAGRFPETETTTIEGCEIASLTLAAGDRQAALLAVTARLSLPPFGQPTTRI
jgi:serine kinase of HPr protein (carbohydrate metabolism regulator)